MKKYFLFFNVVLALVPLYSSDIQTFSIYSEGKFLTKVEVEIAPKKSGSWTEEDLDYRLKETGIGWIPGLINYGKPRAKKGKKTAHVYTNSDCSSQEKEFICRAIKKLLEDSSSCEYQIIIAK